MKCIKGLATPCTLASLLFFLSAKTRNNKEEKKGDVKKYSCAALSDRPTYYVVVSGLARDTRLVERNAAGVLGDTILLPRIKWILSANCGVIVSTLRVAFCMDVHMS